MAFTCTIAGVDKTEDITGVTINSQISTGIKASIGFKEFMPEEFQAVVVTRDGVTVFQGLAENPKGKVGAKNGSTASLTYGGILPAIDDVAALKWDPVAGAWNDTVTNVFAALCTSKLPTWTQDLEVIGTNANINIQYIGADQVFRDVARKGGAQYIGDPRDKTIHLFTQTWGPVVNIPAAETAWPYDEERQPTDYCNQVLVRGGIAQASTTFEATGDGSTTVYTLGHGTPIGLSVTVGGVTQSLAQEGFSGADTADVLLRYRANATAQLVFKSAPALSAAIAVPYDYEYRVQSLQRNAADIAKYGRVIARIISDSSIVDVATARARALGELNISGKVKRLLKLKLVDEKFQVLFAGQKVYLDWLGVYARLTETMMEIGKAKYDSCSFVAEVL